MTGYACSEYADSLTEFGTPRFLPNSQGWILERPTPYLPYRDAMGCYPVFKCGDWSGLKQDLDDIGEELTSLTMVPDPYGDYDEAYLRDCFKDLVVPFKQHYVVDMHRPLKDIVSRHHLKCARKADEHIRAEVCLHPAEFLDEWVALHQNLVNQHSIEGIRAFSKQAFQKQLSTPGMVVLRALHGDETVGAQLWFLHKDVAYGHVLAFNEKGYKLGATYALYWFALNYFADKARWCDIGGVAGLQENENSGLAQFKSGWSTGFRTAYLCGRILNSSKYQELSALNREAKGFFPAYRNTF
ncbi:MAG: hypothetical protein COB20_09475 [SAR86 cluster bacterium]|uniref:BioF2-like acetyltransferase domain-containing protein n=1 Tax=SAR86 cluster bacterium TaxID=2030880 RepID=A0A2A4X2S9_9GAMM|nr:MAG: hypothetical protein COB20_09475 [SAR86 cluster bacterium]